MKSIFFAIAMLFASQAGAATYDATLSGPVQSGSNYRFTYSVGEIAEFNPAIYNAWSLSFTVNGLKYSPIVGLTEGVNSPSNGVFGFFYSYYKPGQTITVDAVIKGYVGANVSDNSTTSRQYYTLLSTGDQTKMGTFTFNTIKYEPFGAAAPLQEQQQLRVAEAAVVPIGGTLPLMLTAIGLGGWMLRSRAKAAA